MDFDKLKELQNQIKTLHSELENVKDTKNIEKQNKLNEIQKRLFWIENDAVNSLFDGKQNVKIDETINRLQGIINTLKFVIKAEQTMKENIKLKEALKAEIRNVLKENQELSEVKTDKKDLIKQVNSILGRNKNLSQSKFDYEEGEYIGGGEIEYLTAFLEWLKKNDKKNLQELARVATTIKISNNKAAQAYVDANKGKWVADMVQAVIDAGDKGITQPDLASKIGKGSQQTINPKVRELLAAGVFTQGEASIKSEPKNNNPVIKALPPKDDEDIEDIEVVDDEEDLDVDSDDYEKPDEDDSEDEDELAKKAAPSKGVDSPSKQLDLVIKKMKDLAKKYKEAEGEEKADITAQLKDLTKEKTKLEKEINKSLGDDDEEDEI